MSAPAAIAVAVPRVTMSQKVADPTNGVVTAEKEIRIDTGDPETVNDPFVGDELIPVTLPTTNQ